jgi:hypothetical protein
MFRVGDGDIFITNKSLNRGCVKVFGKISHLNLIKKKVASVIHIKRVCFGKIGQKLSNVKDFFEARFRQ